MTIWQTLMIKFRYFIERVLGYRCWQFGRCRRNGGNTEREGGKYKFLNVINFENHTFLKTNVKMA